MTKETEAQPVQEPIAKVCHDLEGHIGWNPTAQVNEFPEGMELFAAPLPVQPVQCNYPDCKCSTENHCLKGLAQPEERNFCPRCGKRTADLTTIHTCTPPLPVQPERNKV
jgi:hypothetical protein